MSLSLSQLHSVHHIISDCQLARHCYWLQQCSALSTQQSISVLSTLFARSNSQPAMQYTVWHNMQVLQMYTQNYRSYLSLTHDIKISIKKVRWQNKTRTKSSNDQKKSCIRPHIRQMASSVNSQCYIKWLDKYASSTGNSGYCYTELLVCSLAVAKSNTSTHRAYPQRDVKM